MSDGRVQSASTPQPRDVPSAGTGAGRRRSLFRPIALALSIILLMGIGGAWAWSARGATDFGWPLGHHWFETRLHDGVADVDLFTPDDPLVIRMLERASDMPKAAGPWMGGPKVPSWIPMWNAFLPCSEQWRAVADDDHMLILTLGNARQLPYIPPSVRMPTCGNDSWLFIDGRDIGCRFPLWAPISLLACYPSVVLIGVSRTRRRRRRGLCLSCGYNLTGLPNARCPECGTAFDPRERVFQPSD